MLRVEGYDTRELLYQGRHCLIHRGCRLKDKTPVILKWVDSSEPSAFLLNRLQYEYGILSRIKDKGIPATYGLEKTGNGSVLILEDIGGNSLKSWLMDGKKVPMDDFFEIALPLADTALELYKKNIIHRRIDPFNIIYNQATKRVQIVNFELSSSVAEEVQEDIKWAASQNNFSYLSPEQTGRMNRTVDYRTDLYSLGVTFYEMLTGQLPFEALDVMGLIHHIIARQPIPPGNVNRDIPLILSDMVLKLMAKMAEDRYQSAYGLKCDLEECRSQWVQRKAIVPFPLNRFDIPDQFRISQKLYGRKRETEILLNAFDCTRNGSKELVLISGFSGIGKTSLVKEIHKTIIEHRAYFLSGKSDPFKNDRPYGPMIQAVKHFVAQLLQESEEQLSVWQNSLLKSLGDNGQILIEIIPELELILGAQPPIQELPPVESQIRFHLLFQNFIQTITEKEHPLVILMDDLQWADPGTLNLLKRVIMDPSIQYLLIIGTFREEEVQPGHVLLKMIEEIEQEISPIRSIQLKPLKLEEINQLIRDSFHCRPDQAISLGSLLEQKTGGNPFFIIEFLNALHREKMIYFDYRRNQWGWNAENIQKKGVTSNVAQLMTTKMLKLPKEVQNIMKIAACCGNSFNLSSLQLAGGQKAAGIIQAISRAIRENLIVPFGNKYSGAYLSEEIKEVLPDYACDMIYKFSHDRIHQAAYALMNDKEEKEIHFRIGKALWQKTKNTQKSEDVFDSANHLNKALELIVGEDEKIEIAKLNLRAGERAKASAAHEMALQYFSTGIQLLPSESWQNNYRLTFALYRNLLESEYLNGHFDRFEKLFNELVRKAKTLEEKAGLYNLKIAMFQNLGQNHEAVKVGIQIFRMLGMKFLLTPKKIHLAWEIIKAKLKYRDTRIARLYHLRPMRQKNHQAIMQTYSIMGPSTLFINRDLMVYTALKMLNFTLKYGNSNYAAYVYSGYGTILCSGFKAYESGNAFGILGLKLALKTNEKDVICKSHILVGRAISHWRKPARENLGLFETAYQAAIESGNLIYSAFATIYLVLVRFITGYPLIEVYSEAQKYLLHVKRIKYQDSEPFFIFLMHMVKSLEGATNGLGDFSTQAFNEEAYLKNLIPGCRIPFAIAWYFIIKTQVYYLFGKYDRALKMAVEAEKRSQEFLGNLALADHVFYYSLTLAALWHESDRAKKRKYWSILEKNCSQLKKWAQGCPANFRHKYRLVKAEMESIRGRHFSAGQLYEKAILDANKNLYIQNEAGAAECAARSYLRQGLKKIATLYLSAAHTQYLRWGATAKAKQLEECYADLNFLKPIEGQEIKPEPAKKETISYDVFDVHSIIKASQTISGEILLNTLLEKMLKIIIENAGAQRGVFALRGENNFYVEAEGRVSGVKILPSVPIQEYTDLPKSIINYVSRKSEIVLIGNAEQDTLFAGDPYFLGQMKKSILCYPIMHQGKPLGLFYLENDLVTDAFTPERVELLRLIANQAAISLQNARLYEEIKAHNRTLEEKVEKRTLRLNQMVEQLKESKKAAEAASVAKSMFLANMSHEIRTPLNGILGMAELAIEKARDDDQKKILQIIDSEANALLGLINNILDFSKIEAGKLELEEIPFNLRALLTEICEIMDLRAKAKGLKFMSVLQSEIPFIVLGDPGRLRQVLINLIGNALKFTSQGKITLKAELMHEMDQRAKIRFMVEDTGIGIPKDKQKLIFESFTQADGSTTRRYGGTGLGITISKQLAELMDGEIGLISEENQGSTFWFTIVLKKPAKPIALADWATVDHAVFGEENPIFFESAGQQAAAHNEEHPIRILLAEDYPTNQQVALMYLQNTGCRVTLVENGEKAVEAIKQQSYDLVLMDVQMPVMDGFKATCAIRTWEANPERSNQAGDPFPKKRVPIIAMTAYAIKGDRERCLEAGMDDYISKPFKKATLLKIIKQWIPSSFKEQKGSAELPNSKSMKQSEAPPESLTISDRVEPRQAPINFKEAIEEFEGDREIFFKILDKFMQNVKIQVETMQKALISQDAGKLKIEAHSIKGGAANLTAAPLSAIAAELEETASSGRLENASGIFDRFKKEFQYLETYIGEQLRKAP